MTMLVQNDYDELFSLLDWAVPGGLGDRDQFQAYYENPIKMAQKKNAEVSALGRVRALLERLCVLLACFLRCHVGGL